ncbi:rare lipoprotein A [Candidatus Rickettsiella viridis]|uniref:Endolytic peptidoglycan transglycosylase RlpA n=1 Tax=Candidatus Rickettsiella viridis TaxID=676208 RepID=A0A2Z5V7K2_9COXI|nr:septal ring lytic transglycosylase RlpA family protein [Candidatus Rickettsiella viridis]BBB15487.1 rare lipoprotein A [Candidatus Rickettsiella viridis]
MLIKNKAWQGSLFFKTTLGSLLFMLILALTACSTTSSRRYPLRQDKPPSFRINANKIPNAVPKAEPLSKRGNPKSYVVFGRRYYVFKSARGYHATGTASWYGMKFHRFQTSNGEYYNVAGMTAAHKTLPLPTYLQVTNLRNGKKVIVKVNDRGPFVGNRLIDLSYVAAKKLDMTGSGTAPVAIRAITPGVTRFARNTSYTKPSSEQSSKNPSNPFIHLGLFKQHQQAQKLALLVKQWTQSPVKIEAKSIHKRRYYQVVIGPLPNTKSSQQLHHQLQLAGLSQPKGFN